MTIRGVLDPEARRRRRRLPITEQFPGEAPPVDIEAITRRRELPITEQFPGELPPVEIPTREEARELLAPQIEEREFLELTDELVGRIYEQFLEEPQFIPEDPTFRRLVEEEPPVSRFESIVNFAIEEPENFIIDLQKKGRSEDTELLLELLGATPEDIDLIFPEPQQPIVISQTESSRKRVLNSEQLIGTWREWEGVTYAPGVPIPVTFWEDPGEWWEQFRAEREESRDITRDAATIRRATLAEMPGILGLVNRPLWEGGLTTSDIAGVGLLAYGSYQAARVGWDMFLRSSVVRNLNSWAKSAGVVIDKETQTNFVNTAMANLSRKWLSQEAIRTFFKPSKTGLRATAETVRTANEEINALVQRTAGTIVPRGTQTGALAFGGLPKEPVPPIIASIVDKITKGLELTPEETQFRAENAQVIEDALKVPEPAIPVGLTQPVESLSTAELGRRVVKATPHKELYQAELDRRAGLPEPALEAVVPTVTPAEPVPLPPKPAVTAIEPVAEPVIPQAPEVPDQVIPAVATPDVPHIKDIGILEKVRPTRKVFQKMGLGEEVWKPAFRAETELAEAKAAFHKELTEKAKLIGKDKERRAMVFQELENPGTVEGLTFDEKRYINWWKEKADKWADQLGLSQEERVTNYITHIFEKDIAAQLDAEQALDQATARMLEYTAPKTIFNPFLQKRLGRTAGLIEDPILAAEAYSSRQLKVFYYEPLLEKINLFSKEAPPAASRYLKEFALRLTGKPLKIDQEVNNTLKELGDALAKIPRFKPIAKYFQEGNPSGIAAYNFTSALYFLWLGFKPTSAIRNLSQHTLIMSETGPLSFSEAVSKTLTAESKAAVSESLVMRSRKAAFIPGIDDSVAQNWTDKFRETALAMFRGADKVNVRHAFLSGYYEAKRLLPEAPRQLWIDRGDEVAADTQYLYTKLNSFAMSQSSLGRIFSVLTTWSENWLELMVKWGKANPSQVYLAYEEETGTKLPKKNWSANRKSVLMYAAIIGLAFFIRDRTRLKALEYTGLTSINYIADIMSGDFPALEYPGAVADVVAGILTDNERRLKQGLSALDPVNLMGLGRQIDAVASGDRDWSTLFLYLQEQNWELKKLGESWEKSFEPYNDLTTPKQRDDYRETNPKIEAKLFITGQFTTLSTDAARDEVLRLIEQHNIDPSMIPGYDKVFPLDTNEELTEAENRIGDILVPERELYSTSNFLSEANKLVKTVGRDKIIADGNELAIAALQAQDEWQSYDNSGSEARLLMRQQFPDLEANLFFWGHEITTLKNPNSAELVLDMLEKYGVDPGGIKAFYDDPAKYEEVLEGNLPRLIERFRVGKGDEKYELLGEAVSKYGQLAVKDSLTSEELAKYNWDIRSFDWKENQVLAHYIHWGNEFHKVFKWIPEADEAQLERVKERVPNFESLIVNKLLPIYQTEKDGFPEKTWNALLALSIEKYGAEELKERVEEIGEPNQWDRIKSEIDVIALLDEKHLEAYGLGFSGELADSYIGYYAIPSAGYDNERYLIEHEEFYQTMVDYGIWQEKDFSKVPTVEFESKFVEYEAKAIGKDRYAFRGEDLEFDAEGVKLGLWKPFEEGKIVPEEIERLTEKYDALPTTGKDRLIFRHENPEYEKWLVEEEGYVPVGDRWMEEKPKTEKEPEEPELEEATIELREKLGRLTK